MPCLYMVLCYLYFIFIFVVVDVIVDLSFVHFLLNEFMQNGFLWISKLLVYDYYFFRPFFRSLRNSTLEKK